MATSIFTHTVSKYSAIKETAVNSNNYSDLSGIVFEYTGGTGKTSAVQLAGDAFTPTKNTATEVYRAWRNAVALYWVARRWEIALMSDNTGIRVKLRDKPTAIIIRMEDGTQVFRWDSLKSIIARVGLIPNKEDLERIKLPESLAAKEITDSDEPQLSFNAWTMLDREDRQRINRAASAAFNALKTEFTFEEESEK